MPSTFFTLTQQFFASLRTQRNLSPHTLSAYRDTFRLLLRCIADQQGVAIDQLSLDMLSAEAVLAFLEHLEQGRGSPSLKRRRTSSWPASAFSRSRASAR